MYYYSTMCARFYIYIFYILYIELYKFWNISEKAYSACIYLRGYDVWKIIKDSLTMDLLTKNRASFKAISLELCEALLSIRIDTDTSHYVYYKYSNYTRLIRIIL